MVAHTLGSVIAVDQVSKAYGAVRAVENVSFDVRAGEIFGLLGPNGVGKTTTLAMIEGLRAPDEGRATVLGFDVARQARQIKARIGVQLQTTSLLPDLSAAEQIELFARLYGRHMHRRTALGLLARLGLEDKAHARAAGLFDAGRGRRAGSAGGSASGGAGGVWRIRRRLAG